MPTSKSLAKRSAISEKVADHLLPHGLQGASLRPMAAAAGLSDRMLLHYFETRNDVLREALDIVASRFQALLGRASFPPAPAHLLLPRIAAWLRGPELRPFLRLWIGLAADGSESNPLPREVGLRLSEGFREWLDGLLAATGAKRDRQASALAFATLEGCVLLEALGASAIVDDAVAALGRARRPSPRGR